MRGLRDCFTWGGRRCVALGGCPRRSFYPKERTQNMKFIVLGLCLTVIPGFASTSSCPQEQYSSLVGCQAFDSLLASISPGSVVSDDPTNFASSLFTPEPTSQPVVVVPPSSVMPSTNALSLLDESSTTPQLNANSLLTSIPQVSITSPDTSSLANELLMAQIPLSTLVVPTGYLNEIQGNTLGSTSFSFTDPFVNSDPPSSVPETGSIAMIGSGLVVLSLVATATRRRRRLNG
jgi:hypothetical protein